MSEEIPMNFGTLPLPKKTPQSTREIENVIIKFTDGTVKTIIVRDKGGGFYRETHMKSEDSEVFIQEVFIANGLTR